MIKVVIVDDQPDFVEELSFSLKQSGFEVYSVGSGAALRTFLTGQSVDLIILDVGLPEEDGYSVLQNLPTHRDSLGIVMLTARSEIGDKVRGLLTGADAYLTKPVDIAELGATLHAVTRRIREKKKTAVNTQAWQLTQQGWMLIAPTGETHSLTAQERLFIQQLLQKPQVSRDSLMQALAKDPAIFDSHFIDALVSRLRTKLGQHFPLKTLRGIGYTLSESLDIHD